MQERRQFARWQVNRQASVKLQGQDNPFDCKIEDIGFKGLKIHSTQELKKDSSLALDITLDHSLSLNIEASVVWNKALGADNICGLYFTRIKDIDKEKIYKFVQNNFPKQIGLRLWKGIV